jgi:hypothetical protein
MTHPIYVSRAGRILYRELPEAMRLYDNRNPDAQELGDLEKFLFGFGHMLDRFDATLLQLHADGFLDPVERAQDDPRAIQGWLLPYVAQLFGVELVAPDPDSRRRELAGSIWLARRRGTRAAVDAAAELLTDTPVVVVAGAMRVLRTPGLATGRITHREYTGLWHPADAAILQAPLPAVGARVEGFAATRPGAHDSLPVGTPDPRRAMRAVQSGIERPDAEVRPRSGSGEVADLVAFKVRRRHGRPCFPDSYEDRSLRTPDMRSPRMRRLPFTHLKSPDAVTLFVRPPAGMFTGTEQRAQAPSIENGRVARGESLADVEQASIFYDDAAAVVELSGDNSSHAEDGESAEGLHVIEDLKFAGTVRVLPGGNVRFRNCAIGILVGPEIANAAGARIYARNCLFDQVDLTTLPAEGSETVFEYCTVTTATALHVAKVSDSIMAGSFTAAGDGSGEKVGCVRFTLVPQGFDFAHVHRFKTVEGAPQFVRWPCIERGGLMEHDTLPLIGEPGYGVLSDRTARTVATGAEDGGEMGVYHDAWHLARLAAGVRKARGYLPVGQQVFGHYDTRLLAPLPALTE